MLTTILVLAVIAAVVFFLMKKGKIADANNNNIPDAIENKVAEVKEEVKEVVKKEAQRNCLGVLLLEQTKIVYQYLTIKYVYRVLHYQIITLTFQIH